MKKSLLLSVLASTLIYAGGDIEPVEPNLNMPAFEEKDNGVSIPVSFALLGGAMKGEGEGTTWENMFGAELAFECLFSSSVRSQLQYTHYDVDGIKMQQLSANPHYIFNRGDAVEFGFGPHIGVAKVEMLNQDDTIFTYGAGLSAKANLVANFFIGAEVRYEWTTDAEFNKEKDNLNNAKVFAKIGYSF